VLGFPIRTSTYQRLVDSSTWLIAVTHVLHRFSTPRHPPLALTNLKTSLQDARARSTILKEQPKDHQPTRTHQRKPKGLNTSKKQANRLLQNRRENKKPYQTHPARRTKSTTSRTHPIRTPVHQQVAETQPPPNSDVEMFNNSLERR
jgi:hypothetical protein